MSILQCAGNLSFEVRPQSTVVLWMLAPFTIAIRIHLFQSLPLELGLK